MAIPVRSPLIFAGKGHCQNPSFLHGSRIAPNIRLAGRGDFGIPIVVLGTPGLGGEQLCLCTIRTSLSDCPLRGSARSVVALVVLRVICTATTVHDDTDQLGGSE